MYPKCAYTPLSLRLPNPCSFKRRRNSIKFYFFNFTYQSVSRTSLVPKFDSNSTRFYEKYICNSKSGKQNFEEENLALKSSPRKTNFDDYDPRYLSMIVKQSLAQEVRQKNDISEG